ncbi:MAG: hypothetical protein RRY34_05965, partial [Victivallaceae bacterium]
MLRLINIILLFLLVAGAATSLSADTQERIYCAVCNKKISGKYAMDDDGNTYCSQKCFKKNQPHCEVCDRKLEEFIETADGRKFCSKKCF